MARILRGILIQLLVLTLIPVPSLALDQPVWVETLTQVHDISTSYENFATQLEADFFKEDFENIRRRWAGDLNKQYTWLLYRQYLAHMDSLEYQLELLSGTRSMRRSSQVLFTLPEVAGLQKRHSLMASSLKNQAFAFDNFMEVVLQVSIALSETEKAVPRLEKLLTKIRKLQKTNANLKRIEKLEGKLRDYNSWRSMIFDTFPAFTFLLNKTPLGKKTYPFYTRIKAQYLQLLAQGQKGPDLVHSLTLKNKALIEQELTKLADPLLNYSYRAMRALAQPDYHFFMRHFALRTEVIDLIKSQASLSERDKAAFEALDKNLANRLGIPSLDGLIAPKQMSWTQAGINFATSAISSQIGFAVGFGEAFGRYLDSYLDKDGFRVGALMGINPFAVYDAATKEPYLRLLLADTIWLALGARSAHVLGESALNAMSRMTFTMASLKGLGQAVISLPKNATPRAALNLSKHLMNRAITNLSDAATIRSAFINTVSDISVNISTEAIIRWQNPLDFLNEPNMRMRLTASFIGGFSYVAFINEEWGFAKFAMATSALAFANTTASMILWGQGINTERLLYSAAYNWLIGAVMMKYMFVPFQDKYLPYFGKDFPGGMTALTKSTNVGKEVLFRIGRASSTTTVGLTAADSMLNIQSLRNLYDELYSTESTPQISAQKGNSGNK